MYILSLWSLALGWRKELEMGASVRTCLLPSRSIDYVCGASCHSRWSTTLYDALSNQLDRQWVPVQPRIGDGRTRVS